MKVGFVCVMHQSKLRPNGFELINTLRESLKFCDKDYTLFLYDNASDDTYNNTEGIEYEYIEDQLIGGLLKPDNEGIEKASKTWRVF